jgi:hypothetical protein
MQRRMAANRTSRGRHARRAAVARDDDDGPTGPVTLVRTGGHRRSDAPQPWVAARPSAADLPENYVPRHSVQTPGPAADPSPSISGPIPVVRPPDTVAGRAFTPEGADEAPPAASGPIGGPSLPTSGLPVRRRRGSGPGMPLQTEGTPPTGPATGPWLRPSPTPRTVVPHEPARRLGAPPQPLGGPEPIPAWGLPLATPARGLAVPGGPPTTPDRRGEAGGAVPTGAAAAPAADGAAPGGPPIAPASTTGPAVGPVPGAPDDGTPDDGTPDDGTPDDGTPGDGTPDDGVPGHEVPAGSTDVEATGAGGAFGSRTAADRPGAEAPALNGSAPNGSAPDGSVPNGSAPDGAVPNGSAPDGSVTNGSAPDGSVPNGAVPNGVALNGARVSGTSVDGGALDGAGVDGAGVDEAAVNGRAVLGPTPGPAGRTGGTAVPGHEVADPPTAPQPVVVGDHTGRVTTTGGHPVAVPAQRTAESVRALAARSATPRHIPVVGTAPEPGSTRVRVVLSERKGIARTVRTIKEVQEGTPVGVLLRRDLIRSQLRVTLRFALSMVVVLGALPAVFAFFPQVSEFDVLGVRLPWIMLGVLVYPFLFLVAWRYSRLADRVEQNFADHVQDR